MKASITVFFLSLCCFWFQKQTSFIKYIPRNPDKEAINPIRDSLSKNNIHNFIYLLINENNKVVTYFIWTDIKYMNVIQITDSTISKPLINVITFDPLKNIRAVAIQEYEDHHKFMPPINPLTTDNAFVYISNNQYLVQYGSNANFDLDQKKNLIRKKFFLDIKNQLNLLKNKWQVAKKYDRRKHL